MSAFSRRDLLKFAASAAASAVIPALSSCATNSSPAGDRTMRRRRPSDSDWPTESDWAALNDRVGGRLSRLSAPLSVCRPTPGSTACQAVLRELKNPYYLGDEAALTQTSGWLNAWMSMPSVYAVAAIDSRDISETVNFARERNLRLVIKGGGHSYQGTSNAPDSLLIWTRRMHGIEMHDGFIPQSGEDRQSARPAVTVGAGAIWMHVYDAVTTRAGRYVQGGGCATVGVAGLVLGGGFGSFSKRYGNAAGSLLQAEVVTADGAVRVVNAYREPDLFWALKGGGGGSFGAVTSVTLETHPLPEYFGAVMANVNAHSPEAFRQLIARFIAFYAESLLNEHWGETVSLRPDGTLRISMLFQGLSRDQAAGVWQPFFDWVASPSSGCSLSAAPQILAAPAQRLWDPAFMMQHVPGAMMVDNRPGASANDVFWSANQGEAGQFLYGYESAWLPVSLLTQPAQARLADTLFEATRHWSVSLHFNKGLAGGSVDARQRAADTAMNPAVLDAFALAIIAGEGAPAFMGMPGNGPDLEHARQASLKIRQAADVLRGMVPDAGAYLAESSFSQSDWQHAYWGKHYDRLRSVKQRYDPDGLFFVHQGVSSEAWSLDGFTRLAT
jgi:FAD binding domain/Berberine and berberine like